MPPGQRSARGPFCLGLDIKCDCILCPTDLAIRSEEAREFWLEHETDLPTWFHLVRIAFTVVPTSASVERLFSVSKRVFGELSEHAYEDLVALSVLLRYNTRGSH